MAEHLARATRQFEAIHTLPHPGGPVTRVEFRSAELPAGIAREYRASDASARSVVLPMPDFTVLAGWVAEHTLAERAATQIVRVHHQEDPERRPFVVKILRPLDGRNEDEEIRRLRVRLLREVIALRALDDAGCPNIPTVVTFGIQSGDRPRFWYVMPYYRGGALWSDGSSAARSAERYRGDIDRVMTIARSLATTLAFMHHEGRRCVHGDVSAGNVLLSAADGVPILGDFGNARLVGYMPDTEPFDGTDLQAWRPPELDNARSEPTPAGDIYMLGGLIYEALSGGHVLPATWHWRSSPLREPSEYSLYRYTSDPRVAAVEAMLARLLAPNPKHRLSAAQVAQACRAIHTGRTVGGRAIGRMEL